MRQLFLITILSLIIVKVSFGVSQYADTIILRDYNGALFVISTTDYKNVLNKELGAKAKMYHSFIDSIAVITNDSIIKLDKGYCTILSFYERKDYQKLDNALMEAFQTKKMRVIKDGETYYFNNSKISKRKTRLCNWPDGPVTGVNWVIKDSINEKLVVELNKSITRHAYKCVSCYD